MADEWERAAPLARRVLSEAHIAVLEESKILPEVWTARGYYSPTRKMVERMVSARLHHKNVLKAKGWMAIPIIRPDGTKHGEVLRLFDYAGKMKYSWPPGQRNAVDVHPEFRELLKDPRIPIICAEGIKKGDAILSASIEEGFECVVLSINGNWGWMAKTNGGSSVVPDLLDIVWKGRKVWVVSDSDARSNTGVLRGWQDCAAYLGSKTGESKTLLVVVPPFGTDKQGADDFLAAGGELQTLLGLGTSPRGQFLDALLEDSSPLPIRSGMEVIDSAQENIPHILHPVLPERGIAVVSGRSATYKTWHALSLVLDLAFGYGWLDHPSIRANSEPVKSLYLNKEMGGNMLGSRLKVLTKNPRYRSAPDWRAKIDASVHVVEEADVDLANPVQRERLEEAIILTGIKVVILDSLSMCWSGNENDNSEVGVFYSQLRGISQRTGVSWVIIHHTGKPGTVNKKEHIMFSVRGAGQIVQQADSALIFSPHNEDSGDSERREVAIAYAKTRAEQEPPPFVSVFTKNDGMFLAVGYGSLLSEAHASAYTSSHGDPKKLVDWIRTQISTWNFMMPAGPGMRFKQLVSLLQQNWPLEDKNTPSEASIRRALTSMEESGEIEVLDENKRQGNLLRLKPVEDTTEENAETTEET